MLLIAAIGSGRAAAAKDLYLPHRLDCERYRLDRARSICRSLEAEMQWTWLGHAIVSPGWRVTWETVRRVWCGGVTSADTAALEELRRSMDFRVEVGADAMLRLIRGDSDPASIFNPDNPSYILRDGCP